MRVWIDLSNSPHALLFPPIAAALETRGHEVVLTARDNAQTVELARERWPGVEVIGGPSPKSRRGKAELMAARVRDLRRWAAGARPDAALSHNSYGQVVAARSLGIPAVTAMDFEHQPANHLAFRLARRVLLPEPLRGEPMRRQGASPRKVRWYPGLKEELYLGDFTPDPEILDRIGLAGGEGAPLVVARTAPSRAAYHRFGNPLFEEALAAIGRQADVRCVVLPRHPEQRAAIAALGFGNLIVPDRAVDTRSLMHAADLVIGAGGTMTREAALLGVPTLSVFAGRSPAVDRWLEARGALARLTDADQVAHVEKRRHEPRSAEELRAGAASGIEVFVNATIEAAAT